MLPRPVQSGALIRSEWDVLAAEPPLPRILHSNRRIFLPSHTLMPALHRTYSRMHCTASHMLTPALQRTPILTLALHCRHTHTTRLHCTGMLQARMHTKAQKRRREEAGEEDAEEEQGGRRQALLQNRVPQPLEGWELPRGGPNPHKGGAQGRDGGGQGQGCADMSDI